MLRACGVLRHELFSKASRRDAHNYRNDAFESISYSFKKYVILRIHHFSFRENWNINRPDNYYYSIYSRAAKNGLLVEQDERETTGESEQKLRTPRLFGNTSVTAIVSPSSRKNCLLENGATLKAKSGKRNFLISLATLDCFKLFILILNFFYTFTYYMFSSSTLFKYASIVPITDSTQPSSNGEIKPASFTSFVNDIEPPKSHKCK